MRVIDFPGAFFLEDPATPSAQRRHRLEDLLLLFLRSLLFLAAILALAGPRVKGFGFLGEAAGGGDSGTEVVVLVIDDSPGVAQRLDCFGKRTYPGVLAKVASALNVGPRRRIAVEAASGARLPFVSSHRFGEALPRLTAPSRHPSGDRTQALRRAYEALADTLEDRRVVVLLSDFCLNANEGEGALLIDAWHAVLKDFKLASASTPALLGVSLDPPCTQQWVLSSLDATQDTFGSQMIAGLPLTVRCRVGCVFGVGRRRLTIEGAEVLNAADRSAPPVLGPRKNLIRKDLFLKPGQIEEVGLPFPVDKAQSLWFRARLEGADEAPFDDQLDRVVAVRPKHRVTLIDFRGAGGEGEGFRADGLDDLVLALNPLEEMAGSRVAEVQRRSGLEAWMPSSRILVGVCGASGPAPSPFTDVRLREALEHGASLIWIPDFRGRPEWKVDAAGALAGGTWGDLRYRIVGYESFQKGEGRAGPGWRIGRFEVDAPLLTPFFDGRNGDLGAVWMGRRWVLKEVRSKDSNPGHATGFSSSVLARFEDGHPAMVVQRVGEGTVYQLAFGLEDAGGISASPAWPVLLALFIESAGRDAWQGEGLRTVGSDGGVEDVIRMTPSPRARVLLWDGPWFGGSAGQNGVALGMPGMQAAWRLPTKAGADRVALPRWMYPGSYRLREQEGSECDWALCRVSDCESSFALLPRSVWDAFEGAAKASGGGLIDGVSELKGALNAMQPGRPIASWFWGLFGCAMLIELSVFVFRKRVG